MQAWPWNLRSGVLNLLLLICYSIGDVCIWASLRTGWVVWMDFESNLGRAFPNISEQIKGFMKESSLSISSWCYFSLSFWSRFLFLGVLFDKKILGDKNLNFYSECCSGSGFKTTGSSPFLRWGSKTSVRFCSASSWTGSSSRSASSIWLSSDSDWEKDGDLLLGYLLVAIFFR